MSFDVGGENDLFYVHANLRVTKTPFTIASWAYPTDGSNPFKVVWGMGCTIPSAFRFQTIGFETPTVGGPWSYRSQGVGADVTLTSSIGMTLNQWTHGVATDTGLAQEIFSDGVSGGTDTVTLGQRDDINSTVAGLRESGDVRDRGFGGLVAECAIWNLILSRYVISLLAAGFSPAFFPEGLVAYISGGANQRLDVNPGFRLVGDIRRAQHPNIVYPGRRLSPRARAPAIVGATPKGVFGLALDGPLRRVVYS